MRELPKELTAGNPTTESTGELAGDFAPLSRALGATEALASLHALAELVRAPRPESVADLAQLLACYRERLLGPVELPAIRSAYEHALRGEFRELLDLDRRLARQFGGADSAYTAASRHIGRTQLRRLRPLRDRTLQRYLHAVDEGQATGWHVVVFGLLLSLFSLPLRQGLAHYASSTQSRLLESASGHVAIPARARSELQSTCDTPVPALEETIRPGFIPRLV